jgi:hypothetical protein
VGLAEPSAAPYLPRTVRGGRRRAGLLIGVTLAMLVFLLPPPAALGASEGGPVQQRCDEVDEQLSAFCRGGEQLISALLAACRYAGVPDEFCTTPISPHVSRAAVDRYQGSWVHRALGLQYELADDMGMRNLPWVGTHNSFNSTAEMGPTLSDTDSNQQLSVVDQLRIDVRSIELDLHWFSRPQDGGFEVVVCHGEEPDRYNAGCTVEKTLGAVLDEIVAWLRAHPDQVLMLYLEDDMDVKDGHDAAGAILESKLGGFIYHPPGREARCVPLPLDLSRDQIRAAGKQVFVVSGCGSAGAWRTVVFDWSSRQEERPVGYTDYPQCGPDVTRAQYDSKLIRYYEDSTGVTAGAAATGADEDAKRDEGLTPQTAARLVRCGIDLTGFDQLLPDDGRLEAMVWSWARNQPSARGGNCAIQRLDARWEVRSCRQRHRVACRSPDGRWRVTRRRMRANAARERCRNVAGRRHAVPRTGYEGQLLRDAMRRVRARTVWLAYRRHTAASAGWRPLDRR